MCSKFEKHSQDRCGAGAAFYLHGEVLPPPNPSLSLPNNLRRTFTPRFEVRGLQPFRERSNALLCVRLPSLIRRVVLVADDFPMGPDWWQGPFWKSLSTNMAKLKL